MENIFTKTLRVSRKELPLLLWVILFGAFLGVAVSFLEVASISQFLTIYNNSSLPGAIICSGLLGVFTANTFISIKNWVSFTRVTSYTIIGLIVLCLGIYIIPSSDSFVYVGFVLIGPIATLQLLLFWGMFEKLFDLAQARRVAVIGEAGMVIASIASLLVVGLSESSYFSDLKNLFVLSFYHFVFALVVLGFISFFNPFLTKIVVNVQYVKAFNNYKKLVSQRYVLWMVLFSLLSSIVYFIADYNFLNFVGQQYGAQSELTPFLAVFTASTLGLAFLIHVFIVRWVNHKYGYLVSLLVLPVLIGLFTAIYGILGSVESYDAKNSVFFFIFMLVCIAKGISFCLYRSLEFSTFKFYFMPLDNLLRADIQSKVERVIRESGKIISGLLIVATVAYLGYGYVAYASIVVIGAWSFVTFKMNKAYKEKLKSSLVKPDEIKRKQRVSSSVIEELLVKIYKEEGVEVQVYLSLLKILDPIVYKQCILQLLESENEDVQRIALLETSELCLLPAIDILEKLKESKYYPVLKTRELIDKAHIQLKSAEFRLEKIKYIEQLTLSKLKRERVFGALLSAYSEESMKPRLLNKLFRDSDSKVRYSAVVSSANSTTVELQKNLIEKLGDTFYSNGALSASISTGDKMFPAMENAFYLTGQDEKIQLRIVQAYGRIGEEQAVQLLLKKLNYSNQNVGRAAFNAVSDCGFVISGEKVLQFKAELEEYVAVLVWNMSVYLDLSRSKVSDVLLQACQSEVEGNYESIFKILSLLFDPQVISLIKENLFSVDAEKSEYAYGILENTLTDEIKPFLLPVLTKASYEEKVDKMQEYFPTEPMNAIHIMYDLIQRDYKYVNRWTKACALKELSEQKAEIDLDIFIANIINPDALMRETSSVALYITAPELFSMTFERFRQELGSGFSKELVNKIITNKKKEDIVNNKENSPEGKKAMVETPDYFSSPDLKFEIIKFLKSIGEFKSVPGIVLMELAKKIELLKYLKTEIIKWYVSGEEMDYYFVRSGCVQVVKEGQCIGEFKESSFIHNYFLITSYEEVIELIAVDKCDVYKIRQDEFNEIMSFFQEIPKSIHHNVKLYNSTNILVEASI